MSRRYDPPVHPDGTYCSLFCNCTEGREWRAWIEMVAESRKEDMS